MDVIKRIDDLLSEREWTDYKLAKESGLATSTIANFRRRETVPSISTLENICNAFGITLSQFFNDREETVQLTKDQQKLFNKSGKVIKASRVTKSQKQIVFNLIEEFK